MKEQIQILEDLRPWDCEIFPESKTICYGGGGGGGWKPPKIDLTPPPLPAAPALPTPSLPVPQVNMPEVNVPDISAMNLTPSQGNLDALSSMGQNIQGTLDQNIGLESDFGRAMSANLGAINEGISHNLKQVGIAGQMLGKGLHHNISQLGNIGNIGKGGGGGAGGGGAGAMGPGGMLLGSTRGRDLSKKKTGMSRKKTLLT